MTPPDEFDPSTVKPVVRRRRAAPEAEPGRAEAPDAARAPQPEQAARREEQVPRRAEQAPSRAAQPQDRSAQRPPQQRPSSQQRPPSSDRQRQQRPPRDRAPQGRPPQGRPPEDRAPQGRAPQDRAPQDRAPRDRPQQRRPEQQRPAQQRRPQPAAAPRRARPDDEYVELPPPTSGGRRLLAVGGIVLLVFAILVGGILVWASRQVNPGGEPGEVVESIEVPKGSSTDAIATILADNGVITSARLFGYYAGWKGAGPWNAGEYVDFRKDSSFDEAIEVLDEGPVPVAASVVRVTEGRRLVDALAEISEQVPTISVQQLQETLDSGAVTSKYKPAEVASWEGLLFPDTYQFEADATPQIILQTMASKMEDVLDELGYDKAEALQGRSAYQLIVIASLIEKETGAPPEERGMISRVISNRLDDDETLGIDAAVLYGLNRSSGELTQSDLDTETPYNTRIVKGLPPTPISLVSEASLDAAIRPAEGSWRYYVLTSNDPPTHLFTDSYDEFLEAKDDAQERGVF